MSTATATELADDTEITVELVEEYLTTRRTTLYSQFYNILDPKRRRDAAEWLYGEMKNFADFVGADL